MKKKVSALAFMFLKGANFIDMSATDCDTIACGIATWIYSQQYSCSLQHHEQHLKKILFCVTPRLIQNQMGVEQFLFLSR